MLSRITTYRGVAIIDDSISYTFQELVDQVETYRTVLAEKVRKEDVVVIDADYSFYSISVLLALSSITCVIVPIVWENDQVFEQKLIACGATKQIKINRQNIDIQQLDTQPLNYQETTHQGHTGIVLFSSGTTGKPKVMVHNFTQLLNSFPIPKRQKKLRILIFLLFDHIGGLNTLLSCLNNGATAILAQNRNPEQVLTLMEEEQVQVLPTSPTFLSLMLQTENLEERDLSSLKLVTYGTERMPKRLLQQLNEQFKHVRFLQTFGTSETGILKTLSKSSNSLFFKIVNDDIDHKIVDGQLLLKTKTTVKGYKNYNSEQFLADDWFATGDLVEQDEEGYIKIIGRMNEVINIGGLKVLPIEVEQVINTVEGVIDSTVYGKENVITGQMVCAKVVLASNVEANAIKKKIKTTCREVLEKYKRPAKIIVSPQVNSTPRFKKQR